jgi:ABC-type uncharacterized transport system substrate-binding protein
MAVTALLSLPLTAGDYDQVLSAVRKAWPDASQLAVVCDAASSKASISALASAAGGMKINVLDVKGPQDVGKTVSILTGRKPDVVVLIAGDRIAGDGQTGATFLIQRMASIKVPVVGTTEAAVKQGAVLGAGPGTGAKLLSNPKAAALTGVSLPDGATPIS